MKANIAIAFYPLHWIHTLHDAVLAANVCMVDICSRWYLISCLFLEDCRYHLFMLFNKTRLGRYWSLNGWVAIRCIPASDLANVIAKESSYDEHGSWIVAGQFEILAIYSWHLLSLYLLCWKRQPLAIYESFIWHYASCHLKTPFVDLLYYWIISGLFSQGESVPLSLCSVLSNVRTLFFFGQ